MASDPDDEDYQPPNDEPGSEDDDLEDDIVSDSPNGKEEMSSGDDEDMDLLLPSPLTIAERLAFTRSGIKVVIGFGRSKKDWPQTAICISVWKTTEITEQFNRLLRKYGGGYNDFTPELLWDKQTHPMCFDWNDFVDLCVPWYRPGFKVFLRRIPRSKASNKRSGDTLSTEKSPKAKKQKVAQNARVEAMQNLRVLLAPSGATAVIDKTKNHSLWYRVVHLQTKMGWSVDRIISFIYENYAGGGGGGAHGGDDGAKRGNAKSQISECGQAYFKSMLQKDSEYLYDEAIEQSQQTQQSHHNTHHNRRRNKKPQPPPPVDFHAFEQHELGTTQVIEQYAQALSVAQEQIRKLQQTVLEMQQNMDPDSSPNSDNQDKNL